MSDYILRFFAGGIAVTAFAAIGDVLRPKSFAGLFAAAPSIALATLLLTIADKGSAYVALEARSMIPGAVALAAYSFAACQLLKRFSLHASTATLVAFSVWLVVAFSLAFLWFGAP